MSHILIIEDEPVTRATLTSYLEAQGYDVSEAESADAAERILLEKPIDLLLVDINLPGKEGLKITREQRAKSDIGIILVTGRDDDVDRIVGLEMGADDYVCKPFNRRELLARIKSLLYRTRGGRSRQPADLPLRWFFILCARPAARRQRRRDHSLDPRRIRSAALSCVAPRRGGHPRCADVARHAPAIRYQSPHG